jgi:glycosyltransferase involved in cell wall biosynthesis
MISVIMSNFNTNEIYLKQSIQSILKQSFKDIEFIIIDDFSTNNSKLILDNLNDDRVKIIYNEKNLGLAASLNKALQIARGKYIARMDSDDISYPNRLEKQFKYLEDNPTVSLVGSFANKFGNNKGYNYTIIEEPSEMNVPMFFGNIICHPSVMFRKEALTRNSLKYNENYRTGQDYELWANLMKTEKFAVIPETLLLYRIHNSQISKEKKNEQVHNTKSVYSSFLIDMGISVNDNMLQKHFAFCTSTDLKAFKFEEINRWGTYLKEQNLKSKLYNKKLFNQYVDYTLFKRLVKLILKDMRYIPYFLKFLFNRNVNIMLFRYVKGYLLLYIKGIIR